MAHLNILVADDHRLVSHGVRRILEEQSDWRVVAQASDGREAVRLAAELHPDVAVLDVDMPNLNGIEATAQMTRHIPSVPVLVMSGQASDLVVSHALRAGARGVLLKDSSEADLVRAVEVVAAGQSYFSPTVASWMLRQYIANIHKAPPDDGFQMLSPREREVFQLVGEGRTNREVAEELEISPATVETHRARILRKLDLHNTADLVRYGMRRGVLSA